MPEMYADTDFGRQRDIDKAGNPERYRSPTRRDHARLIHSPSFRRLQGKTQVFASNENDFFRNRLTHSMEVAQIGKSIAIRLNATDPRFESPTRKIDPDIVEFAGLAHDLGHPPFGHNGEEALDRCMEDHGGFEGNAQTLRILSRLEKKDTFGEALEPFQQGEDCRVGLNLTYRSLASVLKYDAVIPARKSDRTNKGVCKGYYAVDSALVADIKRAVLGSEETANHFKTVECSIMDVADDIAYSTYDLEDVFKSGFLKPLDLFALEPSIYDDVVRTINSRLKKQYSDHRGAAVTREDVNDIIFFLLFDLFYIVACPLKSGPP